MESPLSLRFHAPLNPVAPPPGDVLPPITAAPVRVGLKTIATGLRSPIFATSTHALPNYLFVVDQVGKLWRIDLRDDSRVLYLDVTPLLVKLGIPQIGGGDERGFLGIAFSPDFGNDGMFYTYTSEPATGNADFTYPRIGMNCPQPPESMAPNHQNVIRRWHVSNPRDAASRPDRNSDWILRIDWANFNHNGGTLRFGPDGMLYAAFGDGGGEDDQTCQINTDMKTTIGHVEMGNAQDLRLIYGKMIRIDVHGNNSQNGRYGIPADNPFVGRQDALPEIYALGLRNPYRFSFDDETNSIFANDAGENNVEEADLILPGGNYSWHYKEGTFRFDQKGLALINGASDGVATINIPGTPNWLIDPITEYAHHNRQGVHQATVTIGGFMYRGTQVPALRGYYVFGDYSKR